MKLMKIGYVLLIAIAAFVVLPAHGADLDSADLYNCVKLDNEMIVHYNCKEPATVAFCYENIVMKQNAAEIDFKLAEEMHCQARSGFHDPCFFYGSVRRCANIRQQAWARSIASYTVVYGVCARAGNVPRWVSNPGSNGRYTCDSDPMEGSESDDGSDGSAETLSEDDQYEKLFGEYENRLSELLEGDLSSAENLGDMLVESLGGNLSFNDVLGNFGMGQNESGDQGREQTASGDQGTEQVASGDHGSKQSSDREKTMPRYPAGKEFQDCDTCPKMVVVPPGTFLMGSPASEEYREDEEGPQHQVTISNPFAVGKFEVTFREWDACVSEGGCSHRPDDWEMGRGNRPVINVSWNDAQQYVNWLSRKTGKQYRLLSESEWEYVARAGTTGPFHFGSTISTNQANYNGNYTYGGGPEGIYRFKTVSVGSFPANSFGLHDVHGNVSEWVEDCWHENYQGAPQDGSAWVTGGDCGSRMFRGGSWRYTPGYLRSAYRTLPLGLLAGFRHNDKGFRVARTLTP